MWCRSSKQRKAALRRRDTESALAIVRDCASEGVIANMALEAHGHFRRPGGIRERAALERLGWRPAMNSDAWVHVDTFGAQIDADLKALERAWISMTPGLTALAEDFGPKAGDVGKTIEIVGWTPTDTRYEPGESVVDVRSSSPRGLVFKGEQS